MAAKDEKNRTDTSFLSFEALFSTSVVPYEVLVSSFKFSVILPKFRSGFQGEMSLKFKKTKQIYLLQVCTFNCFVWSIAYKALWVHLLLMFKPV